ncbi:MAG: GNAT family N-acetyltransferase [Clostridiaceae bacterium]|nr:GNAT family N-acetyltransferase [Clostridiaceae bacterium]
MIIRKMTIEDYDSVYDLWLNTPGVGLNNLDDSREGIEKFLKRNPETCFVAEKDNKIIGVILCGHDGRRAFIYHTAVSESERRRGVGTALVDAVIDALKKEGISKAALVVFSKNELGNSFWEKRGFTARQDLVYRNKTINELLKY